MKMLVKFLKNNKLAHYKWFLNDQYFQLEKYDVFEQETVIVEKFNAMLDILMK